MNVLNTLSDVKSHTPRLWVQRVMILKEPALNENSVIRTIKLKRGFNIIWGHGHKDSTNPDTSAFTASGHSVGKSSFCRLLRYVLGEPQYGPSRHKEQLKKTYPTSWVAAEICIDGIVWAVARSLVSSKDQYRIGKALKIEDILSPNFTAVQTMADYMNALEEFMPDGLSLPTHKFTWTDLLAWLTRDQSTRLRNFWTWREGDETAKPTFSHSAAHPQHLVLGILNMLPKESETLEQAIHQLQQEKKIAEKKVDSLQKEPKLRLEFAKDQVRILLADNIPIEDENTGDLLSLNHRSSIWLQDRTAPYGQLAILKAHYNDLRPEFITVDSVRNEYKKKLVENGIASANLDDNMASVKPVGNADLWSKQIETLKRKIQIIKNASPHKCPYAKHIKVGACQEAQKAVEILNDDLQKRQNIMNIGDIQRRNRQQKEYEQYAESAKDIQHENDILLAQYNTVDETYQDVSNALSTLKQQMDEIDSQIQRMNEYLTEMNKWQEAVGNEGSFKELNEARADLQKATEDLMRSEKTLKDKQVQAIGHSEILNKLFSELVEAVCGSGYSGEIFDKKELRFHIENDGMLDGAVSDTLSIILGDITAMLGHSRNVSHHPAFHLHDSIREAELGLVLYEKLLQLIFTIHNKLGGEVSAPFQYILTATSTTPLADNLKDVIRLELSADPPTGYLFGKKLRLKSDDDVATLF